MAILAANLHGIGHLAIDQAIAVAVLRKMAIGALQPLFGVNVHQMHRLAGLLAHRREFRHAVLAPFLRVVRRHDLAFGVQQIALAVALENGAEIPAVAVIIGELRVFQRGVEVIDIAQEINIAPFAPRGRPFRVAIIDGAHLLGGGIGLLFRPHLGRIRLVIPHGIAEVAVQKHIGLMHVAAHALRGGNGAAEHMLQRVPAFLGLRLRTMSRRHLAGDGRVDGDALPVAAILGIGQGMARLAVVGIDHMAAAAAGAAIIARLIIGAHEPHERVVQPRFVDVQHWNGDAQPGARPPVALLQIGPPRLLQPLNAAGGIGQANLGKLRADAAPAALEHPEDVAGGNDVPARQRIERCQRAARLLPVAQRAGRGAGRQQRRWLSIARIGLAEDIAFERGDAVIIGRAPPQHGACRHQRALTRLDLGEVAGPAGLARHPVIARVHKADIFRRFLVQQGVATLGVGGGGIIPAPGIARRHMRRLARGDIGRCRGRQRSVSHHPGIAAMAIGAAQPHGGRDMHGGGIGICVAADAAR